MRRRLGSQERTRAAFPFTPPKQANESRTRDRASICALRRQRATIRSRSHFILQPPATYDHPTRRERGVGTLAPDKNIPRRGLRFARRAPPPCPEGGGGAPRARARPSSRPRDPVCPPASDPAGYVPPPLHPLPPSRAASCRVAPRRERSEAGAAPLHYASLGPSPRARERGGPGISVYTVAGRCCPACAPAPRHRWPGSTRVRRGGGGARPASAPGPARGLGGGRTHAPSPLRQRADGPGHEGGTATRGRATPALWAYVVRRQVPRLERKPGVRSPRLPPHARARRLLWPSLLRLGVVAGWAWAHDGRVGHGARSSLGLPEAVETGRPRSPGGSGSLGRRGGCTSLHGAASPRHLEFNLSLGLAHYSCGVSSVGTRGRRGRLTVDRA